MTATNQTTRRPCNEHTPRKPDGSCMWCGATAGEPHRESARRLALNGDGKAPRLVVSLSDEDRDTLLTLALARGVSQAEVVRQLVREARKVAP